MSVKYKRFMLSTCLPAAMCVMISAPAFAGFEWTPPEKVETPVVMEAIPTETVEAEDLSPVDALDETPEDLPPIQIKVMEEELPVPETETAVEAQDKPPIETPIEPQTIEILEAVPETMVSEEVSIPSVEEAAPAMPEMVMPAPEEEKQAAPVTDETFSIEPFPTQDEAVTTKNETVVLPTGDDAAELSDLSSQDVIVLSSEEIDAAAPTEDKILWNEPETFDVIEGFGSDMPLALALSQIVPPRYAFAFGLGVNPGARISWDGGKPWNAVLDDALSALEYSYEVQGRKVLVKKAMVEAPVEVEEQPEAPVELQETEAMDSVLDSVIEAENKVEMPHAQEADIAMPAKNIETGELKVEVDNIEIKAPQEINIPANDPVNIIEVDETSLPTETTKDEQAMAPVEVDEKDLESVPAPEYAELESKAEGAHVSRQAVLDPGQVETQQPELTENPELEMLADEKKNEVNAAAEPQMAALSAPEPVLKVLEIPAIEEAIEISEASAEPVALDNIAPAAVDADVQNTPANQHREQPSNKIKLWEAKSGQNLKEIIEKWSAEENIHLVWDAMENYEISQKTIINGTFKNAVDVLFTKGVKDAPVYSLTEAPVYEIRVNEK